MAKRKGRLMLVTIGNGADPEVFNTQFGLRSKTFTINNNAYDVTTADEGDPEGILWREVQNGITSMSISGNGFIKDNTAEAKLVAISLDGDAVANCRVNVPSVGNFVGPFHLDSLEFQGELENGLGYSISMSSAGEIVFSAPE